MDVTIKDIITASISLASLALSGCALGCAVQARPIENDPADAVCLKREQPSMRPKIFLRTQLYTTGPKGRVIENMHLNVRQDYGTHTFDFGTYGRRQAYPWQRAFRRLDRHCLRGCFHREHSPCAYELIDSYLSRSTAESEIEEHESGPELLVYLAVATAGLTLAKSIIDLVTSIIKARSEGVKSDRLKRPLRINRSPH